MIPRVPVKAFLATVIVAVLTLNVPLCGAWDDGGTAFTTRATRHVSAIPEGPVTTGDNVDFRPPPTSRANTDVAHTYKIGPGFVHRYVIALFLSIPALKLYEWHHSYLI